MYLHSLSSNEILKTEIGWCEPWIYEFKNGKLETFKIVPRPEDQSKSSLNNYPEKIQLKIQ